MARAQSPKALDELLVAKARARCAEHLGPIGFCHICFRAELEDLLAAENPELKRDDVVQLVDQWMLAADDSPH